MSGRASPGGGLGQPEEGIDASVLALLCIGIADASVLALSAWPAGLELCIGSADSLGPCNVVPLNCEKGLQAFLNHLLLLGAKSPLTPRAISACIFWHRRFPLM